MFMLGRAFECSEGDSDVYLTGPFLCRSQRRDGVVLGIERTWPGTSCSFVLCLFFMFWEKHDCGDDSRYTDCLFCVCSLETAPRPIVSHLLLLSV